MKYQICFDIVSGNNHFLHHIKYCQDKQEYYNFLSMKCNDLKRVNEYFRQFGLRIELSLQQQEFIFYGNKVTLDPEKQNQELQADPDLKCYVEKGLSKKNMNASDKEMLETYNAKWWEFWK